MWMVVFLETAACWWQWERKRERICPWLKKRAFFCELFLPWFLFNVHVGCPSTIGLRSLCLHLPNSLVYLRKLWVKPVSFLVLIEREREGQEGAGLGEIKVVLPFLPSLVNGRANCASHCTGKEVPPKPPNKPTQHGDTKNKIHTQKKQNQENKHRNLCHLKSGRKLCKKGSPPRYVYVQWKLGMN